MKIPQHIAIIMDGNGRWAQEKGLPRAEGHRRGALAIETVVEACREIGVRYLTLYAFSQENWQRPITEIESLMGLLRHFLKSKREKMLANGIQFKTIGDIDSLPADIQEEVRQTMLATSECRDLTLIVALSYSSRSEICRALTRLLKSGAKKIDPENFSEVLDTAGIPDPDLLIRTSGEYRLSNFLLWQLAYAELIFTETHWPEFGQPQLVAAIEEYGRRERRFGRTGEQING